eukprot:gb/GECG01016298.1/.p1 GENE.gb/GECG01016298.1/~~gb/GECG01016298.1/.p1  ORF type:complete len:253 (+),score=36.10 gb/GECG01016298.1/:1-759(+)
MAHKAADTELVWYASFGSNMCLERFLCYIQGGHLEAIGKDFEGASDKTPPKASIGLTAPHKMFFARESKWWKGGVGFIDPRRTNGYDEAQSVLDTLSLDSGASDKANETQRQKVVASTKDPGVSFLRAYLITLDQYNDVVRQENKGKTQSLKTKDVQDLVERGAGSTVSVSRGWYGNLLHIGDVPYGERSYPVLTFTCHEENAQQHLNDPSESYQNMIVRGMKECHWTEKEARKYVNARFSSSTTSTRCQIQ